MNDSCFDKRMKSVRGLPKGDFQTYRQIFDTKTKFHYEKQDILNGVKHRLKLIHKTENILQLPYTDDEKTTHLKMTPSSTPLNKSFDYMSEEKPDTSNYEKTLSVASDEVAYENNNKQKCDSPKYELLSDAHSDAVQIIFCDDKVQNEQISYRQPDNQASKNDDKKELNNNDSNLLRLKELSKSCNLNSTLKFVQIDDIDLSDESFEDENDDANNCDTRSTPTICSNSVLKNVVEPSAITNNIELVMEPDLNDTCKLSIVPVEIGTQPVKTGPLQSPIVDVNSSSLPIRSPIITSDIYARLKEFQNELNMSFNINTPNEFRIEAPIDCPTLSDHIYETVGSTAALDRRILKSDEHSNHQSLKSQNISAKSNTSIAIGSKSVSRQSCVSKSTRNLIKFFNFYFFYRKNCYPFRN
jgi:hypothetical protein